MNLRRNGKKDAHEVESIEFQVVGERREDPGHLLLMCRDGRWYDYDLMAGEIQPLEPDDSWSVDVSDEPSVTARRERELIAS